MISVNEIVKALKEGKLDSPDELSKYLVILSAQLDTAGNLELMAEIEYAKVWKTIKEENIGEHLVGKTTRTDKMTEMISKATPEYLDWQKARNTKKTMEQCIMSLKKRLANLNIEYNIGQNYN